MENKYKIPDVVTPLPTPDVSAFTGMDVKFVKGDDLPVVERAEYDCKINKLIASYSAKPKNPKLQPDNLTKTKHSTYNGCVLFIFKGFIIFDGFLDLCYS